MVVLRGYNGFCGTCVYAGPFASTPPSGCVNALDSVREINRLTDRWQMRLLAAARDKDIPVDTYSSIDTLRKTLKGGGYSSKVDEINGIFLQEARNVVNVLKGNGIVDIEVEEPLNPQSPFTVTGCKKYETNEAILDALLREAAEMQGVELR